MPADDITISEDRYENELTQRWLNGISTGWEYAAAKLREQSGKAYADGLDDRACILRDLARQLLAEAATAEKRAKEHEKEYLTEG